MKDSTFQNKVETFMSKQNKCSDNTHWDNKKNKMYNNCYSYAFKDIASNAKVKPQPGFKNKYEPLTKDQYTCSNFIERILQDYPNSQFLGNDPDIVNQNLCQCGDINQHLVFLALDLEDEDRDYHFYRQDENGLWTHKPGPMEIHYTDAKNNFINNPYYADRKYSNYNYSTSCGFFCVKL